MMLIKKVLIEPKESKIFHNLMKVEEVTKVGNNIKSLFEQKNREKKKRNKVLKELEEEWEE